MLANLIHSALIPPLQMSELQNKLAAFSMEGLSVPMPPINVTPLPLFKTPDATGFMDLSSLVKALPGNASHAVNQDAVMAVMQVLAAEHRELMVSRKEAEIDKQASRRWRTGIRATMQNTWSLRSPVTAGSSSPAWRPWRKPWATLMSPPSGHKKRRMPCV